MLMEDFTGHANLHRIKPLVSKRKVGLRSLSPSNQTTLDAVFTLISRVWQVVFSNQKEFLTDRWDSGKKSLALWIVELTD